MSGSWSLEMGVQQHGLIWSTEQPPPQHTPTLWTDSRSTICLCECFTKTRIIHLMYDPWQKWTHLSSPGVDVPVNVQIIGCELYCEITSWTLMYAVWNSTGAKVTSTSVSSLAGMMPEITNWAVSWQNQQNELCTQGWLRSAWAYQSLHCALNGPNVSLCGQHRLKDLDAQADLSIGWAQRSFCWWGSSYIIVTCPTM